MGLAAAKAKGVKLGDPNIKAAQEAAVAAQAEPDRAANNLPPIAEIPKSGATTLRGNCANPERARRSPPARRNLRAMSVRNVPARNRPPDRTNSHATKGGLIDAGSKPNVGS
jgi:hypothetical protein